MNIASLKRPLLLLVGILIVPFTFYWAHGNYPASNYGLSSLYDAFSYTSGGLITAYSVAAYLSIFFAFISQRNSNLRSFLIVMSGIFELLMIQYFSYVLLSESRFSLVKTLRYVFYRTDNAFPVQLFNSIALVFWSILVFAEWSWLKNQITNLISALKTGFSGVRNLFNSKFADLIAIITVITFVLSIKNAFDEYKKMSRTFHVGFHIELIFIAIGLLLSILLITLAVLVPLLYLLSTYKTWNTELNELRNSITDFRLTKYLTRLISGYLYWLYSILIITALALVTPMQTILIFLETSAGLSKGFHPELILILVGFPLAAVALGYLAMLVLRLVFELFVALVHIAQNTRKGNQLT